MLFNRPVPSDEACRAQYRNERYLRNLPDDDLAHRGRDIYQNFMHINQDGKLAPLPVAHRLHGYWRGRFLRGIEKRWSKWFENLPEPNEADHARGVELMARIEANRVEALTLAAAPNASTSEARNGDSPSASSKG